MLLPSCAIISCDRADFCGTGTSTGDRDVGTAGDCPAGAYLVSEALIAMIDNVNIIFLSNYILLTFNSGTLPWFPRWSCRPDVSVSFGFG
jgi:hypothetical protein